MTFWYFDGFDMFWYHQGTWSIKKRCRSDGICTFGVDGKDPNPCATWSEIGQFEWLHRFWSMAMPRWPEAWATCLVRASFRAGEWEFMGLPPFSQKSSGEANWTWISSANVLLLHFVNMSPCDNLSPWQTYSTPQQVVIISCDVSWFRLSACVKSFDSGDCCLW